MRLAIAWADERAKALAELNGWAQRCELVRAWAAARATNDAAEKESGS